MNGRAWQVLRDLEGWHVTELPRRPHAAASQDQASLGVAQRLQALVSAFHYGGPVAFGWVREHPGGPVRILAAGVPLAGIPDALLAGQSPRPATSGCRWRTDCCPSGPGLRVAAARRTPHQRPMVVEPLRPDTA